MSERIILGELKSHGGTIGSKGNRQWNLKERTRDFLGSEVVNLSLGEGLNTFWKTGRSGYWRVVVKNFAVRVRRRN